MLLRPRDTTIDTQQSGANERSTHLSTLRAQTQSEYDRLHATGHDMSTERKFRVTRECAITWLIDLAGRNDIDLPMLDHLVEKLCVYIKFDPFVLQRGDGYGNQWQIIALALVYANVHLDDLADLRAYLQDIYSVREIQRAQSFVDRTCGSLFNRMRVENNAAAYLHNMLMHCNIDTHIENVADRQLIVCSAIKNLLAFHYSYVVYTVDAQMRALISVYVAVKAHMTRTQSTRNLLSALAWPSWVTHEMCNTVRANHDALQSLFAESDVATEHALDAYTRQILPSYNCLFK